MASKPALGIGLVGYQFMGRAHSNAYRQANRYFDLPRQIRMKTICGRTEAGVSEAAGRLGWEGHSTDWRTLLDDPEIDVIDVSTPGDSHEEIAIAAAEAGKAVWCEKPIANTLAGAEAMHAAVKKSGVHNGVFHNYRKCPAIALAKQIIADGRIGEIHHVRAVYLQDWIVEPSFPLVWRLVKDRAGSGSLGDIGSHSIDLARHLAGEITDVMGHLHTFVKERPVLSESAAGLAAASGGAEMGEVTVDDAAFVMAKFANGAMGTFEASRFCQGRKNYNRIEINGRLGSLVFNMERMNELEFFSAEDPEGLQGFRTIQATEGCHPWCSAYWPTAHIIGYEHTFINWVVDAVRSYDAGEKMDPDFDDGLMNQRVLDAITRSAEGGAWAAV
jgi:predicted dehydrogenase